MGVDLTQFQMCLLDTPERNFTLNTPATIFLKDGQLKGDVTLLRLNSNLFKELLVPKLTDCQECKNYIFLLDFSLYTMVHLLELLNTGVTAIVSEEEKRKR